MPSQPVDTLANANMDVPIFVNPDTLSKVYGRVFYGLKYDPATGVAYFEVIENDEIITIPDPAADPISYGLDDYQIWLSSKKYLDFTWETATSSNLIMEVS